MRMLKMKYILFAAFLLSAAGVSAQKAERDYIRKGNRLFNDNVQFGKYALTTTKVSGSHGAI